MDRRERRELTKELALEAGYRVVRFTTGSEYLHYGRFESDIPADYVHLRAAQDRYLDRLIELIPGGVKTILDVGAGSGKTAEVLLGQGYRVDCVSPGKALAARVEERLAGRGKVYQSRFEDAAIDGRYDLVLFSESFQYIPMATALEKGLSLLNPRGHILIADFFSRAVDKKSPIRGGHRLADWQALHPRYPVEVLYEDDITRETAPLHDILQTANRELFLPLAINGREAALARWPALTRTVLWLFRKQIRKAMERRFSEDRTGAEFARAKAYKIYLLRAAGGGAG